MNGVFPISFVSSSGTLSVKFTWKWKVSSFQICSISESTRCLSTLTPRTSLSPRRPGISLTHLEENFQTFDNLSFYRFWSNYVSALKGKWSKCVTYITRSEVNPLFRHISLNIRFNILIPKSTSIWWLGFCHFQITVHVTMEKSCGNIVYFSFCVPANYKVYVFFFLILAKF